MADTAVAPQNYNSIIDRQQKRIHELEADLAGYSDKIRLLKNRKNEDFAAFTAASTAHGNPFDYAHAHAAQVAMLAMSGHPSVALPYVHPNLHAIAAATSIPVLPVSSNLPGTHVPPSAPEPLATHPQPTPPPSRPPSSEDDERTGKTRYWTEVEHNQFLYASKLFGPKNYVAISQLVGTRTAKQVRTHAQKYQMKLDREAKKRRANAAAVAAVTSPNAAAAAAAAAACSVNHNMPVVNMPVPMLVQVPRAERKTMQKATTALIKHKTIKMEVDADQSSSTCATLHGVSSTEEMQLLRESACSPVSNDSDGDCALDMGEGIDGGRSSSVGHMSLGLKKNPSLGNLADYDDFMKCIANAVQDPRNESEIFQNSNTELEVDMLDTPSKGEQFEDSLLDL